MPDLVIGLCGPLATGKSTVARYLADAYDAEVVSTRGIIAREAQQLGLEPNRVNLQDVGQRMQTERGPLWVTEKILEIVVPDGFYVIDAVRHVESLQCLHSELGGRFNCMFVSAPESTRRKRFTARNEGGEDEFARAVAHLVESEVLSLAEFADAVVDNRGSLGQLASQVKGLVHFWALGRVPVSLADLIETVRDFHLKNGFEIGSGEAADLARRLPLLFEELGEIARWTTRKSGDLAEEHADLLILLLGNALVMDLDIEAATVEKLGKILGRSSRMVAGVKRVSRWGKRDIRVESRLDRICMNERLSVRQEEQDDQLQFPFDDN